MSNTLTENHFCDSCHKRIVDENGIHFSTPNLDTPGIWFVDISEHFGDISEHLVQWVILDRKHRIVCLRIFGELHDSEEQARKNAAWHDFNLTGHTIEQVLITPIKLIRRAKERRAKTQVEWETLVDDLASALEAVDKLLHRWSVVTGTITPGGSEYIDNPERCAEFILERRNALGDMVVASKKRIFELEVENEAMRKGKITRIEEFCKDRQCVLSDTHREQVSAMSLRMKGLQQRIAELEEWCNALNSDAIVSRKTIDDQEILSPRRKPKSNA